MSGSHRAERWGTKRHAAGSAAPLRRAFRAKMSARTVNRAAAIIVDLNHKTSYEEHAMEHLPFNHLPYLDRVKIQTEILLPLFRRMRDELGNERACELLRGAVHEYSTTLGEELAQSNEHAPLEKIRGMIPIFAADNAVAVDALADTDDELTFNVTKCKYAEYFHDLGEPEFGAILTCEIDPPLTKAIGAGLTLERTQTRMSNAGHCDFSWKQR